MTIRRTIRIIAESGEEVQPENIHHFADFCGRVSLPPENVATMKKLSNSLDKAGLVLHGFRPMAFLPATNLMSKAVLAIANDSRVRGSGRALYNLKRSMKKKGVFAVGELLLRATATSKMVALVPRDDESDWFVVTQLPYREDVRDVPEKDIGFADRDSVDAAKRLISKCVLRFDDFASCLPENPYLKHFFGYLESVSLGKKLGRVEDDARMDVHFMMKDAMDEIESFSSSLPEDEQPVKKERKRKAPPPSSKDRDLKKESIGQDWIDMYKNDEIADMKNDELKAFLKAQGERLSGKKNDLVDRVHRCIEKELFKE
jgi:ATP-dependent DNA helicase 2 subunit 1